MFHAMFQRDWNLIPTWSIHDFSLPWMLAPQMQPDSPSTWNPGHPWKTAWRQVRLAILCWNRISLGSTPLLWGVLNIKDLIARGDIHDFTIPKWWIPWQGRKGVFALPGKIQATCFRKPSQLILEFKNKPGPKCPKSPKDLRPSLEVCKCSVENLEQLQLKRTSMIIHHERNIVMRQKVWKKCEENRKGGGQV